uniref:SOCS box domain-containing protein n=1 Tax=Strigamia maritima TaxID=126957 RepID=T1JB51_STRMM
MGTLCILQCRLLVAIQTNDIKHVRQLLELGIDSDIRFQIGSQKRPAICLCTERGNVQMGKYVQLLIQSGCSINQTDSSGLTPLHIAVSHGYKDLVFILLKSRANVKTVTPLGYTPLHLAAQRSSLEVIKLLIEAGSDIERYDREGKTPLVHACIFGNNEIIKYLISLGADVNTCDIFGNSPLLFVTSAAAINLEIVETLVENKAKVDHANKSGETALHAAITGRRSKKSEVLQTLINSGCNLNLRTGLGHTALHLAVLEHEDYLIEILTRAGCNLDTRDELGLSPLFHLARDGNFKMAVFLVAASVNVRNETWLKDPKLLLEIRNESLKLWLSEIAFECPPLTLMCRIVLRNSLGRSADNAVGNLDLPTSIKNYVGLKTL